MIGTVSRRKAHDEGSRDESEENGLLWRNESDDDGEQQERRSRYKTSSTPVHNLVTMRKWLILSTGFTSVLVILGWAWLFHSQTIAGLLLSERALVEGLSFAVVTDVSRPYFHAIRDYYNGTGIEPKFYVFIDEDWDSEAAHDARALAESEGVTVTTRRFCQGQFKKAVFAAQRNAFCNVLSTVVDDPSWASVIIEADTYPVHDVEDHMRELRRIHAWPRGESGYALHHVGVPGHSYGWIGSGSLARSWSSAMRRRLWSDYCLDPEASQFCEMGMDTSWSELYHGSVREGRALLFQHTGNLSGKPMA